MKYLISSILLWLADHIEWIISILFVIFLASSICVMTKEDAVRFSKNADNVKAAWGSWTEYRDRSCNIVKKTYGIAIENGKFHSNDNMITYQCNDGIEYAIAQSVEEDVQHCYQDSSDCRANVDRIPKISK